MRSIILPLAALLLAGALADPARADFFTVRDNAGFFSPDTIKEANSVIARIKRDYNKDLLIETFAERPDKWMKVEVDRGRDESFKEWARERYSSEGVRGIYILICKKPSYIRIQVGDTTRQKAFTVSDARDLETRMIGRFRKKEFDTGLLDAVNFVADHLEANIGKQPASRSLTPSAPQSGADRRGGVGALFGGGLMGMLCVGLLVVLGIWLVIGLFRAFSGGGGYGGYGGGGYGGGYGGGWGGFFPSLIGGMFGAAAGAWMYNSFFHSPSSFGGSAYGDSGPATSDATSSAGAGGSFDDDQDGGGGSYDDEGGGGSFDDDGGGGSFDDDGGGGGFDDGGGGGFDGGGGDVGGGDFGGGGGGDF